jgi:uridine kinase
MVDPGLSRVQDLLHGLQRMKSWLLGLCGGTCSGKSTLSRRVLTLLDPLETTEISFDSYYRPLDHMGMEQRRAVNFDHPDSLDVELFTEHLRDLRKGHEVDQPSYDFERHTRGLESKRLRAAPLVLVDGILLLSFPEIRSLLDFSVFLDVPESERLGRRVARDQRERGRSEASIREQFETTVAPMHRLFVQPSSEHAELILDGRRPTEELAQQLASEIRDRLAGSG